MPESLIHHAFIAGELSPTLRARSDLEKYDLGLSECRNFFVDYRGGVSTRPGTAFVDYVKEDTSQTRIVEFRFSPDIANTYLMLFGNNYVRFIQDGAYTLETAVNITSIDNADPAEVTATAHGYSDGDWVRIFDVSGMTEVNLRTFVVAGATTNTFTLQDPFGNDFDASGFTVGLGGQVARIYEVTTTYAAADLARLKFYQKQDTVFIRHPDYAPRKLVRAAATSWTLTTETAASPLSAPTGLSADPSSAGSAGMAFAVTAVDTYGQESLPSRYVFETASVDYSATTGSLELTWTGVTGAKYYNVYRTLIRPTGTEVTYADEVGFIGRALGPRFVDYNIVPDFTKEPPQHYDPFADGAITAVDVTSGGSGYTRASTVTVSGGGGSGFVGYPVVDNGGSVLAVVIVNPGSGYSSPTVSFSVGSGAAATATAGPSSGNYPSVMTIYEQRAVSAGTVNLPMTLFGSKPGDYDNYDTGLTTIVDTDGYEFTIDDQEVSPIRHLMPLQNGLLVASRSGVWLLRGSDDNVITATKVKADSLSFNGFSTLEPIKIDSDILYTQAGGNVVKALVYNQYSQTLSPEDLSTLSNHLFTGTKEIEHWTWAEDPFRLVWAQRSDGALLSFTYVREQKVFAWAQHWTRGKVKDVQAVLEDGEYVVYLLVDRYLAGRWTTFVERMAPRVHSHVEEAWAVDCGLELERTYPDAELTPGAATGTGVSFTTDSAVFTAGDVGSVIRAGGGKAVITAFVSSTEVTCTINRDISKVVQEDSNDMPLPAASGDWTLDAEVTSVSGLWHLEGETVKVLADGDVLTDKVVTSGSISLGVSASVVVVGLGFTARGRTLPATSTDMVVEGKRKRVVAVSARVYETRGLKIGGDTTTLYQMKDRTTEDWGEPTEWRSDASTVLVEAAFEEDGSIVFQQDDPLPATVLGVVLETDVGDTDTRND